MFEIVKNVRWGKVAFAGLLYAIIFRFVYELDYLLKVIDTTSTSHPILDFKTLPLIFVLGFILAFLYEKMRPVMPDNRWKRIFYFTILLVLLSTVLTSFPLYLTCSYKAAIVAVMKIKCAIIFFLASIAFQKLLR